jgi:hypothetical protein
VAGEIDTCLIDGMRNFRSRARAIVVTDARMSSWATFFELYLTFLTLRLNWAKRFREIQGHVINVLAEYMIQDSERHWEQTRPGQWVTGRHLICIM